MGPVMICSLLVSRIHSFLAYIDLYKLIINSHGITHHIRPAGRNLQTDRRNRNFLCHTQYKALYRQWDEEQQFPVEIFRDLGELGLMGMLVPEEYGGAGLGYKEYVTAIIALAKVDPSVGLSMAAHNSLCTNHIICLVMRIRKEQYLPELASGDGLVPGG